MELVISKVFDVKFSVFIFVLFLVFARFFRLLEIYADLFSVDVLHRFSLSKVTQLYVIVLIEKHVARLEVPVRHICLVQSLQGMDNLCSDESDRL